MSEEAITKEHVDQLADSIDAGDREDRARNRAERLVNERKGDGAPEYSSNEDTLDLHDAVDQVDKLLERDDRAVADELGDDPEPEPKAQADDSEDVDDGPEDVDDDDSESDESDDDSKDDPWKATRTVKVDGEEIEVTPDEAIAGYQRQSASTRRFQEAAELRKQAQATISKYDQALGVIEQAFPGMQAQIAQMRQPAQAAMKEEQEATVRSAVEESLKQFHDNAGRFDDDARAQAEDAWFGYLQGHGVSVKEMKYLATSPLALSLVEKARLYDQATGGRAPGKAKDKGSPTLKPGSKTPQSRGQRARRGQKKLRQNFAKSGSMSDALALVETMIDD